MQKQLCIFLFSLASILSAQDTSISLTVAAQKREKSNVLLATIGVDVQLKEVARELKYALEYSGQCSVEIMSCAQLHSKEQIKQCTEKKGGLIIFLSKNIEKKAFEWRLYDAISVSMLHGKLYHPRGDKVRGWAFNIADELWPLLTGQEGFFSTKIAYCKNIYNAGKKKTYKYVCIADFDGGNEQLMVTTPTINIAPRWHVQTQNPLLFYSESTSRNIRLMTVSMDKRRKIASNYDGINMVPTFNRDGSCLVYCASRGNGNCQLYCNAQGELKKLTHNNDNNVSPSLAADGTSLYFCSDMQTGKPHIVRYSFSDGSFSSITNDGLAYCPAYFQQKGKLAYCKLVQGFNQIFIYDEKLGNHTQITFDQTNKDECCWSPCGNFLMFGQESKGNSRIARLNLMTNERFFVTSAQSNCSYPAWSGRFAQLPYCA